MFDPEFGTRRQRRDPFRAWLLGVLLGVGFLFAVVLLPVWIW